MSRIVCGRLFHAVGPATEKASHVEPIRILGISRTWYAVHRHCNPGIPNPGIPNPGIPGIFFNPEIPGLGCSNTVISGLKNPEICNFLNTFVRTVLHFITLLSMFNRRFEYDRSSEFSYVTYNQYMSMAI